MSEILQAMLSSQPTQPSDGQAPAAQGSEQTAPQGTSVDNEFLERFNRLASKEAGLRKREQEIRAERETWKQKVDRLERLERLKAEDPEAALQELGLSYDQITERRLGSLGGETDKTVQQMQKELQALKEQLTNKDKMAEQERVGQELQRANDEVRKICEADDFELIRANDSYDLVLETAAEYFHATGKMVSLADCAKHVEQHLEQKLERILAAKKVANRIKPPVAENEPDTHGTASQESHSLSSSMASSTKPSLMITEDDLRQAALRALRGGV